MSCKLKEALSKASIALSWAAHHHLTEDDAKECLEIVDAALAEPLRNCDVGTVKEQIERFVSEVESGKLKLMGTIAEIIFTWENMQYESEVK
jgi:hypothetical protein